MANKFAQKRIELEYLEEMYQVLEAADRNVTCEWGDTGEVRQATCWNRETHKDDPQFNDDGSPKMVPVYGYVPKSELDDDDRARLEVIKYLKKKLEAMM